MQKKAIASHLPKEVSPICVSIFAPNPSELNSKIAEARKFAPLCVELRLDYLGGVDKKISPQALAAKLEKTLNLWGKDILTLRANNEGGVSKIPLQRRVAIIGEIVRALEPWCVDVEIATLKRSPALLSTIEKSSSKLIASSHYFGKLESTRELEQVFKRAPKSAHIVKIVRKAANFDDNKRLLSLYKKIPKKERLIAFCTGPHGVFSRLACVDLGAPFTYASLPGEPTASGQLDAEAMRALLSR